MVSLSGAFPSGLICWVCVQAPIDLNALPTDPSRFCREVSEVRMNAIDVVSIFTGVEEL